MPLVDTVCRIWRGERDVSGHSCCGDPITSSDQMATPATNNKLRTVLGARTWREIGETARFWHSEVVEWLIIARATARKAVDITATNNVEQTNASGNGWQLFSGDR
jgi:hypothetical protein